MRAVPLNREQRKGQKRAKRNPAAIEAAGFYLAAGEGFERYAPHTANRDVPTRSPLRGNRAGMTM